MRHHSIVVAALLVLASPFEAGAQPAADALSEFQIAVACGPPPLTVAPNPGTLHVIGAQDTVPRTAFGERDLLVIGGGTAKGMQLGQLHFVRRPVLSGVYSAGTGRHAVHTAGWIRIVAANETTSIATVERACDFIQVGDYLEPFVVPDLPAGADAVDRSGELDFTALGRVLFGEDERATASIGEFMLIDRGAEHGMAPGARLAIYREVRMWMRDNRGSTQPQLPLSSIGESVVVAMSPKMAVVRILAARDAVQRGDFVVPRKK